jgi:hypothetical protein
VRRDPAQPAIDPVDRSSVERAKPRTARDPAKPQIGPARRPSVARAKPRAACGRRPAAPIRVAASALAGAALAGCVATPQEAPGTLATFLSELDAICAQTFPTFAGAEARMRALGYVERGAVPGMHSDPERGLARPRYIARPTEAGRPTCTGTITSGAGEASVVAALRQAYPLEPLGDTGDVFRYRGGALTVGGRGVSGTPVVVVVMAAPR